MEIKYPFLGFILKHWKRNLYIGITYTILLIILVFFIIPLEYTSGISILPSAASFSQGMLGSLGNLGKMAGIDIGGGSKAQSQEIYMGIIFSKRLLDQVIYQRYEFEEGGELRKQNLVEYFEFDDLEDEREISEKMLKAMREGVVVVDIDQDNDILYLDVTTENPFLSAAVADNIIKILNMIVKTEVQKEYRQKLSYLENRLSGIEDSLVIAEKELMIFLETNIDPTIPAFQVEQLRLQRNLRLQTELLIEFRKQLEIFIADNMVNLADIKVLDQAYPPYRKSRPKRALLLIALTMLAGFIHLGVNVSVVILQKFKNELNGQLLEKDQTKT
jgi:capsule polysaccharide export protein KpsE/RkpR